MAYSVVAPIIYAVAMGLGGAFMFGWGLFRPRPTTSDKVRWAAVVLTFFAFCVAQASVAQRQGISDVAGPLGKAAAYGVRTGEAIGLTTAALALCISIYGGLDARMFIPGITGLGIGVLLVLGSLVRNVDFNMYLWWTFSLVFFLLMALTIWLIDNAGSVAGIILRDGTPLPKWNGWPWRIVLHVFPAMFIAIFPFAADTTGGMSFTTFFVLSGLFEVAIVIGVVVNYFVAKSVDIDKYVPMDGATNADLPVQSQMMMMNGAAPSKRPANYF